MVWHTYGMTTKASPQVHDTITGGIRIEGVIGDGAYLVSREGGRWSVPVEYLNLVRPAVRGGAPAEWAISPAWTEWDDTNSLPTLY